MTRVAITGGPRTGKTTLAREIAERGEFRWVATARETTAYGMGLDKLHHTDDLIPLGWSEASAAAADLFNRPGPWIVEGVAVSRALRKWRDQNPGKSPPVDRVIYLSQPHEPLNAGQARMAGGVATVHAEIEPWLKAHGITTEHQERSDLSAV